MIIRKNLGALVSPSEIVKNSFHVILWNFHINLTWKILYDAKNVIAIPQSNPKSMKSVLIQAGFCPNFSEYSTFSID